MITRGTLLHTTTGKRHVQIVTSGDRARAFPRDVCSARAPRTPVTKPDDRTPAHQADLCWEITPQIMNAINS